MVSAALAFATMAHMVPPVTIAGTATMSPPVATWAADTASDWPMVGDLAACTEEDGSAPGQPFPCLWDAATMGDGHGQSFYLTSNGMAFPYGPTL